MSERVWRRRLRWRWRGAWRWPTFLVGLLVDTVIMSLLPTTAAEPHAPFAALLLAAFFQLVAVVAVAPLVGLVLARTRPSLPRFVAHDRAATALLAALTAALLVAGLV